MPKFFTRPPPRHPESARYNERPYITIAMHLGVQPGSPNGSATKKKQSPPHPSQASTSLTPQNSSARAEPEHPTPSKLSIDPAPAKVQPTRQAKKSTKSPHPRYALTIVGCSSTVYDVIGTNDKDKYAALLTSRDVLEHPRQGDIFVKAVLRLKPYWTKLAQSFHWATDEDDKEVEAGLRELFAEVSTLGTGREMKRTATTKTMFRSIPWMWIDDIRSCYSVV